MVLATTVLLWSTNDQVSLEKIAKSGVQNVAISVDAGEIDNDTLTILGDLGKRVLAKQFSTKEDVEELCAVLDTTEIYIDCSNMFVSPNASKDDVLLGLDPTVYNIYLLVSFATFDSLKVACEDGFEDVTPIFMYHGTVDKILKQISKENSKSKAVAITFVEYMDRPVLYANLSLFQAFTEEVVFWSVASLEEMVLTAPEVVEEKTRKDHTLIECVRTTSVRIAPSFASRIDTSFVLKPGDRYEELESKRPQGSTALFSKILISGSERWVVRSNNQEVYFTEVE